MNTSLFQRLPRLVSDKAVKTAAEWAIATALTATALLLMLSEYRRLGAAYSAPVTADSASTSAMTEAFTESVASSEHAPVEPNQYVSPTLSWSNTAAWCVLLGSVLVIAYDRYLQQSSQRELRNLASTEAARFDDPDCPNYFKRQELLLALLRHFDSPGDNPLEVQHAMSRKVKSVRPETSLGDLRSILSQEHLHHLLVLKDNALLGLISDRDIVKRSGRTAADILTSNVLDVPPRTAISQAISVMLANRISCLPVIQERTLKGILTVTDMLLTLQCLLHLVERSQADPFSQH